MKKIYVITFNTYDRLNTNIGFVDSEDDAKKISDYINNALMREKMHKDNFNPDYLYNCHFKYGKNDYIVNYRGAWSDYYSLDELHTEWIHKNM